MDLLIDRPAVHRRSAGVVRVVGPDRMAYLHTLLSQDLQSAAAGAAADFLYMDAKGTVLAAGRVIVRADDVLLVTPSPAVASELAAALEKFKFLLQVQAADVSGDWVLASIRGPDSADVPGAPAEPMTAALDADGVLIRDRSRGVDLLGPPQWIAARLDQLRLEEAAAADFQAWRILAGEPAWESEIAPGRRAQEIGLLPTHVHLRKGCYPGQESIAKIYNLGRPRRALAVAEFDAQVAAGDRVEAGGKAGEITSAARARDRWVALALLPLDPQGAFAGDGRLVAGEATGRVLRRVGEGLSQPGAQLPA